MVCCVSYDVSDLLRNIHTFFSYRTGWTKWYSSASKPRKWR